MSSPTRGEWKLLPVVEDFGHPMPTTPPTPYAALVVTRDFGQISRDDLGRLCTQLALSGCSLVDFHGMQSDLAEDLFDDALVILGVALAGDPELGLLYFAGKWVGPVEESPAARWGTHEIFMSVCTTERRGKDGEIEDSLSGSIEMMPVWMPTLPEHVIALPLDDESGNALRDALDGVGVVWSESP